jgi:integrase/recombinase XerD
MINLLFRMERPFLFGPTWETLVEPNDWLHSLRFDGKTRSPRTWRTYAYSLGGFLAWCQRRNLDWKLLLRSDMDRYLDSLTIADQTINRRIWVLVKYYRWCVSNGLALQIPFAFRETSVRVPGFLRGPISRMALIPTALRHVPSGEKVHVPSSSDIWAVRGAVKTWRDQLIIDTFICTGLRCSELLSLEYRQFATLNVDQHESPVYVSVSGKGRKVRKVPFPAGLIRNLQRYIALDRKFAPRSQHTQQLFLSSRGKGLSPSGVEYLLRIAGKKNCIRIHPHLLRHFFACHRLKYFNDLGIGDALGQLQRELGHSQISTTMRYLHLTDQILSRIASDHQDFIAMLGRGSFDLSNVWHAELEASIIRGELQANG